MSTPLRPPNIAGQRIEDEPAIARHTIAPSPLDRANPDSVSTLLTRVSNPNGRVQLGGPGWGLEPQAPDRVQFGGPGWGLEPQAPGRSRLERVGQLLDTFGVSSPSLEAAEQRLVVRTLTELTTVVDGLADGEVPRLRAGQRLQVEQESSSAGGEAVHIRFESDGNELELRFALEADSRATYSLSFGDSRGGRVHTERTLRMAPVPFEDGTLVVLHSGVEDWSFSRKESLNPGRPASSPDLPRERALRKDAALDHALREPSPRPQEGLGSFLAGAAYGSFSNETSWSGIAGNVAVGFIPVAGQVADVRDLLAALRDWREGEPGSGWGIGFAAIAFVPGLDFLKAGRRVHQQTLRAVAEASDPVAESGLKTLRMRLSKESVALARKHVDTLAVGRSELLERFARAPRGLQNLDDLFDRATNALRTHMTRSDLVGALRDRVGLPVRREGRKYSHIKEVSDALQSLENLRSALVARVRNEAARMRTVRGPAELADAIREYSRRTREYLEIR
jgi:hypothetical protein